MTLDYFESCLVPHDSDYIGFFDWFLRLSPDLPILFDDELRRSDDMIMYKEYVKNKSKECVKDIYEEWVNSEFKATRFWFENRSSNKIATNIDPNVPDLLSFTIELDKSMIRDYKLNMIL